MADQKITGLSEAADRDGVFTLAEAQEKGYFGTTTEDKPNEAFTVAGVTQQTMETQENTAAEVQVGYGDKPAQAPRKSSGATKKDAG